MSTTDEPGGRSAVGVSNILSDLPAAGPEEGFAAILERPSARIERIVSHGHVTPPDQAYVQDHDEWVMLVEGAAKLRIDGAGEVALGPGDHLLIPAGSRHRVTWTAPDRPTVWLAVHLSA